MDDWKTPTPAVLMQLASLLIHLEELKETGHHFDASAAEGIMMLPNIQQWLKSVPEVLLPAKRR